uniref:Uncharacterized protein n=1 Tax=Chromera velia CCMP2878 TaxID=1169474 RepID=A0A0G4HS33_9ALVE|eukprot:Cvel_30825.t1-p1 / transcript=Cvel_30825.t1 / gene=Cvel_30825 / organism=Chromera_velia_CCMP2878 / gene_product=hypothetical protein / transcript_product=hypothetical protein / location=Cvel_scaffold4475:1595-9440(+) / protein_length=1064 / sequence_SO=supercontig / SO=protein_coding / is_pseudo=false
MQPPGGEGASSSSSHRNHPHPHRDVFDSCSIYVCRTSQSDFLIQKYGGGGTLGADHTPSSSSSSSSSSCPPSADDEILLGAVLLHYGEIRLQRDDSGDFLLETDNLRLNLSKKRGIALSSNRCLVLPELCVQKGGGVGGEERGEGTQDPSSQSSRVQSGGGRVSLLSAPLLVELGDRYKPPFEAWRFLRSALYGASSSSFSAPATGGGTEEMGKELARVYDGLQIAQAKKWNSRKEGGEGRASEVSGVSEGGASYSYFDALSRYSVVGPGKAAAHPSQGGAGGKGGAGDGGGRGGKGTKKKGERPVSLPSGDNGVQMQTQQGPQGGPPGNAWGGSGDAESLSVREKEKEKEGGSSSSSSGAGGGQKSQQSRFAFKVPGPDGAVVEVAGNPELERWLAPPPPVPKNHPEYDEMWETEKLSWGSFGLGPYPRNRHEGVFLDSDVEWAMSIHPENFVAPRTRAQSPPVPSSPLPTGSPGGASGRGMGRGRLKEGAGMDRASDGFGHGEGGKGMAAANGYLVKEEPFDSSILEQVAAQIVQHVKPQGQSAMEALQICLTPEILSAYQIDTSVHLSADEALLVLKHHSSEHGYVLSDPEIVTAINQAEKNGTTLKNPPKYVSASGMSHGYQPNGIVESPPANSTSAAGGGGAYPSLSSANASGGGTVEAGDGDAGDGSGVSESKGDGGGMPSQSPLSTSGSSHTAPPARQGGAWGAAGASGSAWGGAAAVRGKGSGGTLDGSGPSVGGGGTPGAAAAGTSPEDEKEKERATLEEKKKQREEWYNAELADTRKHIDSGEQDRIRVGPPVWVIAIINALRELLISPFALATRMRGSQKNSNQVRLRVVKDKREGRYSLGKDDGKHRPQLAWKVLAERGEQMVEVYIVCFLTAADLQAVLDHAEKAVSLGLKEGLLPPADSDYREDKRKSQTPASEKLVAKVVKMCRAHPVVTRERQYNELLAKVENRILNPTDWAKYINFTHLGPVHTRNRDRDRDGRDDAPPHAHPRGGDRDRDRDGRGDFGSGRGGGRGGRGGRQPDYFRREGAGHRGDMEGPSWRERGGKSGWGEVDS